MRSSALVLVLLTLLVFVGGCASFRTGVEGCMTAAGSKNLGAAEVKILFVFSHYEQAKGYDAIPLLQNKHQIIRSFEDLFIDALKEITNVGRYDAFTEFASDVGDTKRRDTLDSLVSVQDFVVRMTFNKEHSFVKHFLGTLFSTVSVTALPIPYSRDYSLNVNVHDKDGALVGSYERKASLTKWVESLLIFVYPFYTEKRVEEEIYINFMHDVFRQMESEKVLILKE